MDTIPSIESIPLLRHPAVQQQHPRLQQAQEDLLPRPSTNLSDSFSFHSSPPQYHRLSSLRLSSPAQARSPAYFPLPTPTPRSDSRSRSSHAGSSSRRPLLRRYGRLYGDGGRNLGRLLRDRWRRLGGIRLRARRRPDDVVEREGSWGDGGGGSDENGSLEGGRCIDGMPRNDDAAVKIGWCCRCRGRERREGNQ
jgi:hypothetical protein